MFPRGSVQFGSVSIDSPKKSINPFSHCNTIDGNSLFAVKVVSPGAGKYILSLLQTQL